MFAMKKILISCFAILMLQNLFAQYDPSKVNSKAVSFFEKAFQRAQGGNYPEAIALLNNAIQIDANYLEAYLSLAGVYGEMKNTKKSIANYEKAFAIDSNFSNEYRLPYSINLAREGRFNDALNAINALISHGKAGPNTLKAADYRRKSYQFAVDYAASHPNTETGFVPINLGDSVNTYKSEYYPSITIDKKVFVFTQHGSGIREDFMQCTILPNHQYSKAQLIPGSLNDEPSKGGINISQDGEWLIYAGNFPGKGFGNFDLYISYNTPQGWSEPQNLGPAINTDYWESSPSLSPDKKILYFSSNRPGGKGGKDLYMSRNVNGKWQKAENMGSLVNTAGDELAPFIHADNNTLYFTSDGLQGYGGSDLFIMRRKNADEWNAPENMGYPINTIENDGSLFITSEGVDAYYASDRSDSRGGLDLYRFELRKDLRPSKTLWVQGQVFDKKTKNGLPSTVELIDLKNNVTISKIQTDEQGYYLITLPVGKDYAFNVNRRGYLFYSDNFLLAERSPDSTYEKNIPLQPIEVNASIVLNNIFFETNKYELKTESQAELDKVVQLMNDNPTLRIEISGHTDNVGKPADNMALSNNRAKAVIKYLTTKGIAAQRMLAKGYGATKPVADNKTEEGKARNRRTELKVVAK